MIFGAIDPGKNGALVIIEDNDIIIQKFNKDKYISKLKYVSSYLERRIIRATDLLLSCSSTKDILNEDINKPIIALEAIHSMPGNGVRSMFTFGENFGWIQGVLDTLGLKYELIRPQEWKKHFGLIGSDKKQSCIKALELEPTLQCKGKRGGLQDGICDAYLLAKYLKDKYE